MAEEPESLIEGSFQFGGGFVDFCGGDTVYGITGSDLYHFVNLMAEKRHSVVMHSPIAADRTSKVSLKTGVVLESADYRGNLTRKTKKHSRFTLPQRPINYTFDNLSNPLIGGK